MQNIHVIAEECNDKPTGRGRNRHTTMQQSFQDIGVLRMPDWEKPHVKVRLVSAIYTRSCGLHITVGITLEVDSLGSGVRWSHNQERDSRG